MNMYVSAYKFLSCLCSLPVRSTHSQGCTFYYYSTSRWWEYITLHIGEIHNPAGAQLWGIKFAMHAQGVTAYRGLLHIGKMHNSAVAQLHTNEGSDLQ